MRVTDGMRQASVLRNLQDLQSRHADATQRAQTGMRVNALPTLRRRRSW